MSSLASGFWLLVSGFWFLASGFFHHPLAAIVRTNLPTDDEARSVTNGMTTTLHKRKHQHPARVVSFRWGLHAIRIVAILTAVVALGGMIVSFYAYRQVGRTERAAQSQLRSLGQTIAQSADTLRSTADASTQGAATVDMAATSLSQTSGSLRDVATTVEATAKVLNFTIPITNTRPLAGADENFRQVATQLRTIATSIDQTQDSLGKNSGNLRTIGQQVAIVAGNMDDVARQLRQSADGPSANSAPAIAGNVRLVLIWSMVLHLLLLVFAISFYILASIVRQMLYHELHMMDNDDTDAHGDTGE